MPLKPGTRKVETRTMQVGPQPGQLNETLSPDKNKNGWGGNSVVEQTLAEHTRSLGLNPQY